MHLDGSVTQSFDGDLLSFSEMDMSDLVDLDEEEGSIPSPLDAQENIIGEEAVI